MYFDIRQVNPYADKASPTMAISIININFFSVVYLNYWNKAASMVNMSPQSSFITTIRVWNGTAKWVRYFSSAWPFFQLHGLNFSCFGNFWAKLFMKISLSFISFLFLIHKKNEVIGVRPHVAHIVINSRLFSVWVSYLRVIKGVYLTLSKKLASKMRESIWLYLSPSL